MENTTKFRREVWADARQQIASYEMTYSCNAIHMALLDEWKAQNESPRTQSSNVGILEGQYIEKFLWAALTIWPDGVPFWNRPDEFGSTEFLRMRLKVFDKLINEVDNEIQ